MLHTETVARSTLELLKMLESESVMSNFNLAGGTSLALYLGHRISVDLDLFTPESYTYFDDIDFEEDIVMLNGKYDWKLIERRLIDMTQIQNKVFESFPLP